MRGRAEALFSAGAEVAGDPYGAEALGRTLSRRVAELADDPRTPLFFGRLDIEDANYYVGRRHVTDDAGEPMVLDWRAPLFPSLFPAPAGGPPGGAAPRRVGVVWGAQARFEDRQPDPRGGRGPENRHPS